MTPEGHKHCSGTNSHSGNVHEGSQWWKQWRMEQLSDSAKHRCCCILLRKMGLVITKWASVLQLSFPHAHMNSQVLSNPPWREEHTEQREHPPQRFPGSGITWKLVNNSGSWLGGPEMRARSTCFKKRTPFWNTRHSKALIYCVQGPGLKNLDLWFPVNNPTHCLSCDTCCVPPLTLPMNK